MRWPTDVWSLALATFAGLVVFLMCHIQALLLWLENKRHMRALGKLGAESKTVKEAPLLRADVPGHITPGPLPEKPTRVGCRRRACVRLCLSGDLASRSRYRFMIHMTSCDQCKEEYDWLLAQIQERDRCIYESDVRLYVDSKLSPADLEKFKAHRRICSSCDAMAEAEDDQLDRWLTEWKEAFEPWFRA